MHATTRRSCATRVLQLCVALLVLALVAPRAEAATPTSPTAVTPTPSASMCDHSYSGLLPHNSLDDVRAGYYTGPPFQRVKVAVDGDVDWTLDPYQSLQWRMWLDTLGWAGPLLLSYDRTGNREDLALAMAYARDYVEDQPMDASTPDRPVLQQSSRRLHFLSCLYERDPQPWIAEAIEGTVDFLAVNWAGLYNHGLDQDNAIVVAGCVLGRTDWIDLGRDRLSRILPVSIDDEGATNEQSTAYAVYTYNRWVAAQRTMTTCGLPPLAGLASRLRATASFIAHATKPDGLLAPIGDTYPSDRGHAPQPGTPLSGVWVQNGWAFGRSSWAAEDDPSHFSLRFGPARQIHGHADHGSVTLYANGAPVITEPGSLGYTDTRRFWFRTAAAKNVLLIGKNRCTLYTHATLLSSRRSPTQDRYVVQTPHCDGMLARRAVTYTRGTGALTVDDTTPAQKKAQRRHQLWHLAPGTTAAVKRTSTYRTVVQLTMPNGSTAELVSTSVRRGASARAAARLATARAALTRSERALQAAVQKKASRPVTTARKRALVQARAQVRKAAHRATLLEDRGALRVALVTGRTDPYQGWASAGSGKPVPATTVIVSQSAKAANILTAVRPD